VPGNPQLTSFTLDDERLASKANTTVYIAMEYANRRKLSYVARTSIQRMLDKLPREDKVRLLINRSDLSMQSNESLGNCAACASPRATYNLDFREQNTAA